MSVIAVLLICEAGAQRSVVHWEHDHHKNLWEEGVGNERDTHELDHAIATSIVQINAAKDSAKEENYIGTGDEIEPIAAVLDPLGVATIRDCPAVSVN